MSHSFNLCFKFHAIKTSCGNYTDSVMTFKRVGYDGSTVHYHIITLVNPDSCIPKLSPRFEFE